MFDQCAIPLIVISFPNTNKINCTLIYMSLIRFLILTDFERQFPFRWSYFKATIYLDLIFIRFCYSVWKFRVSFKLFLFRFIT